MSLPTIIRVHVVYANSSYDPGYVLAIDDSAGHIINLADVRFSTPLTAFHALQRDLDAQFPEVAFVIQCNHNIPVISPAESLKLADLRNAWIPNVSESAKRDKEAYAIAKRICGKCWLQA